MSILHIVQFSLPEISSGYALRTQAVVRTQNALGLKPAVVTSPRHPTDEEREVDGVRHFRCSPERHSSSLWSRDVRRVKRLANRVAQIAADLADVELLHAHSPMLCGMAALRARRRLALPVVYEVRGLWEETMVRDRGRGRLSPRYLLARTMERRVCRRADAVVTISKGLRTDLIQRGVPADKIRIVPNGVDTETLAPRRESPGWRSDRGLSEGPLILYLGALRRYEGIAVLIEAFAGLKSEVPSAQLLIVGQGEDRDRIEGRANALGQGVAVLPPVPHDSVAEFYASADVVVYPRLSTRATELVTPLKPLEAMAMGKAIVASDVGGLRELLADGETAHLVRPGSVGALAKALLALLGDEAERRRLGHKARQVVQERFDWRTVVQPYGEIYRAVCSS